MISAETSGQSYVNKCEKAEVRKEEMAIENLQNENDGEKQGLNWCGEGDNWSALWSKKKVLIY